MQKKTQTKKAHTTITDLARLLTLLQDRNSPLTQKDMAVKLSLSPATVTRLLQEARQQYRMVILRPLGRGQPYRIESWGLLNQTAILNLNGKDFRKVK